MGEQVDGSSLHVLLSSIPPDGDVLRPELCGEASRLPDGMTFDIRRNDGRGLEVTSSGREVGSLQARRSNLNEGTVTSPIDTLFWMCWLLREWLRTRGRRT